MFSKYCFELLVSVKTSSLSTVPFEACKSLKHNYVSMKFICIRFLKTVSNMLLIITKKKTIKLKSNHDHTDGSLVEIMKLSELKSHYKTMWKPLPKKPTDEQQRKPRYPHDKSLQDLIPTEMIPYQHYYPVEGGMPCVVPTKKRKIQQTLSFRVNKIKIKKSDKDIARASSMARSTKQSSQQSSQQSSLFLLLYPQHFQQQPYMC